MHQRFRTPSKTLAPIQHQEIWRKVPPCQLKGYQVVLWIDGKIGWSGIGLNATSIQAIPGTSSKKLTGINTQCFFRDILGTVQGWIYHASLASTWHKSLQSLQYRPMVVMWSARIQNTPDSPLRPCALSAFSTAQTSELIRAWVENRQRWSSQFLLVYFIWLVIWIPISVVLWWFYDIFWFACFLSTESDFVTLRTVWDLQINSTGRGLRSHVETRQRNPTSLWVSANSSLTGWERVHQTALHITNHTDLCKMM